MILASLRLCVRIAQLLDSGPFGRGSNPYSAKLSLRVRRVAISVESHAYESQCMLTLRGRTLALLSKQKASQCPRLYSEAK